MNALGRKILIILGVLFLLIPFSTFAGEMYLWTDDQGAKHITDHPPDRPAQVIDRSKFKEMTPAEVEYYRAEQNYKQQQFKENEQIRKQRVEEEVAIEREREQQLESERAIQKAHLEKARRNVEDLEARRERYRYHENNAYGESGRMYWKDEVRKIDRAIKDNKEYLNKNQ